MKRLLIDLEKCLACKDRKCSCNYPHRVSNKGVNSLLEEAIFAYVCRQCQEAPCVAVCPNEALERLQEGTLKRHNARCIGCKSCMLACPFGSLIEEMFQRLWCECDFCSGRISGDDEPFCVSTCPHGALEYVQVKESRHRNITFLGDRLAVRCIPWSRQEQD